MKRILVVLFLLFFFCILPVVSIGAIWVQNVGLLPGTAIMVASDSPAIDRFMATALKSLYGSRIGIVTGYADNEFASTISSSSYLRFLQGTFTSEIPWVLNGLTDVKMSGYGDASVITTINQVSSLLTADAPLGQDFAIVADASLFKVGQHVAALDDNSYHTVELFITDIDAGLNKLTFHVALNTDLTVLQNAVVRTGGLLFRNLGSNRVTISDVSIDLNKANYSSLSGNIPCGYMQAFRSGDPASDLTLHDLTIKNTHGYSISCHDVTNLTVSDSKFLEVSGGVMLENTCTDISIRDNLLRNTATATSLGRFFGAGGGTFTNVSVVGNIVYGFLSATPTTGIYLEDNTLYANIVGNIIKNGNLGIKVGTTGTNSKYYNVVGNTIDSCAIGMVLVGQYGVATGNTILNYNASYGPEYSVAISGTDITFRGNTVALGYKEGINVSGTRNAIENNTVVNNNVVNGDNAGIEIDSGTGHIIQRNDVYDTRTPKLQRYGIRLSAGTSHIVIGNECINNLNGAISDASTGLYAYDNRGYVSTPDRMNKIYMSALDSCLGALGNVRTLLPFIDATGTVINDISRYAHNGTAIADISTWATLPTSLNYTNVYRYYFSGSSPNGIYINDHADFTFSTGLADSSFSCGALIYENSSGAERTIIAKYDAGSTIREWYLYEDSNNRVHFDLYDENADAWIGRYTSILAGGWHRLYATYDGSGLVGGIGVYDVTGGVLSRIDTTDEGAGAYVAMQDTTAKVTFGFRYNGGVFASGFSSIYATPFITATNLSLDQMWQDYRYIGLMWGFYN